MKWFLLICLFAAPALGQVCKSSQYDMLKWMAPQLDTQNGHYNMVYPMSGTFYWVKSSAGYPWDINLFDQNFIYQSITEYNWNDPHTYKIFNSAIKWTPRCIKIPSTTGGKIATVTVPASSSGFKVYTSCSSYTSHNLGNIVSEIWGPTTLNVGGNIPAGLPTLTMVYRYACDSAFQSCKYKETFAYQKGVGLVKWTYSTMQNGAYVQVNQSINNKTNLASIAPVHPCW